MDTSNLFVRANSCNSCLMIKLRVVDGGIVLSVKVQPNASKDRVVGEHADQIKIAVTVAPEKGKANKAVI